MLKARTLTLNAWINVGHNVQVSALRDFDPDNDGYLVGFNNNEAGGSTLWATEADVDPIPLTPAIIQLNPEAMELVNRVINHADYVHEVQGLLAVVFERPDLARSFKIE